jgi:Holliday junction resolvase
VSHGEREAVPTETAVQEACKRRLVRAEAWVVKCHQQGHGRRGVPDLIAVWEGRPLALECKQPAARNRTTPAQVKELKAFAAAGGIAAVVWDARQVDVLLNAACRCGTEMSHRRVGWEMRQQDEVEPPLLAHELAEPKVTEVDERRAA